MSQIGEQLLTDAKAAALTSTTERGEIEKSNLRGRDLLSLLVKANLATDNPQSQRLTDKDVIARAFCSYAFSLQVAQRHVLFYRGSYVCRCGP